MERAIEIVEALQETITKPDTDWHLIGELADELARTAAQQMGLA